MSRTKEELLLLGITPNEIQHNQHRRAAWQDYGDAALYMVTLAIEGRRPLFGTLAGHCRAQRGTTDFPHIALSEFGRAIMEEEVPKMHRFYPQVEVWQVAVMPDHLHLLIRVTEALPRGKRLGDVINGFKGGCTRAWWRLQGRLPAPDGAGTTAGSATAAGITVAGSARWSADAAGLGTGSAAGAAVVPVPLGAGGVAGGVAGGDGAGERASLFEAGYHDRIIKRPGMLDNIKRYMADNPLRAVMRRELPNLLARRLHLRIGEHEYAAFGGLFLLKRSEKEQVFYHRKDRHTGAPTETTEWFRQEAGRQLAEAREGVVLVSPAISQGERMVIQRAVDERLPVIHLQKEPMTRYWKPERHRFEACACGTLLILSPWRLDEELTEKSGSAAVSDYARFHRLNDLAAEICGTTDVVLRDVGEMMIESTCHRYKRLMPPSPAS